MEQHMKYAFLYNLSSVFFINILYLNKVKIRKTYFFLLKLLITILLCHQLGLVVYFFLLFQLKQNKHYSPRNICGITLGDSLRARGCMLGFLEKFMTSEKEVNTTDLMVVIISLQVNNYNKWNMYFSSLNFMI